MGCWRWPTMTTSLTYSGWASRSVSMSCLWAAVRAKSSVPSRNWGDTAGYRPSRTFTVTSGNSRAKLASASGRAARAMAGEAAKVMCLSQRPRSWPISSCARRLSVTISRACFMKACPKDVRLTPRLVRTSSGAFSSSSSCWMAADRAGCERCSNCAAARRLPTSSMQMSVCSVWSFTAMSRFSDWKNRLYRRKNDLLCSVLRH